jgi:putative dehydrogenase
MATSTVVPPPLVMTRKASYAAASPRRLSAPPPHAMKRKRATVTQAAPPRAKTRAGRASPKPKVTAGVIGLGIMGSAMAASLLRAGFRVVGYDVMPHGRQQLRRAGGTPVSDCAAVGRMADIIITSLPSSEALIDVAMQLIADPKGPGRSRLHRIVIETSTLPIAVKVEARALLATLGIILLDCPLSGTGAQARTKDLAVYASGDRAAYSHSIPVLEGFARAHSTSARSAPARR